MENEKERQYILEYGELYEVTYNKDTERLKLRKVKTLRENVLLPLDFKVISAIDDDAALLIAEVGD